jgi:hypothetical protein
MSQGNEEMRSEYDIRGGVRGKYLAQYHHTHTGQELGLEPVRVQNSPWLQAHATESLGEHARQSTLRIGAEPIYVLALEVGKPDLP